MGKFKELPLSTKATIAYIFANLVSKGIAVISVPIFTRLLTPAEIGVGTTYSAWYSILYTVVTLSLCSGSLNIAMLDFKDRRNQYESACLALSSITCIFCIFLYAYFKDIIDHLMGMSRPVMYILWISILVNPALDFWYARQRYEYRYISSVIVSVGVAVLSTSISILCIISSKIDWRLNLGEVKIISQASVLIFVSVIAYFYIMIKGKVYVDIEIWKYALSLSLPLIIHALSKSVLDLSDRLMISIMCGQAEAGIYGTVYSLAMLSLIVWNAINAAIIPYSFENLEKKNIVALNRSMQNILMIFGGVSILVTLLAPEILKIFTTNDYYSAVQLIPALSAGIYFTALYNMFGNFLLYKKKTVYIMFGTVIAAITNLGLNYFFIRVFGYIAAAYTTLLSFMVLAIMQGLMCKKLYNKNIIDKYNLILISMTVTIISLSCNFLYNYTIVRYCVVVISIIMLIMKKNTLLEIIRGKRSEEKIMKR